MLQRMGTENAPSALPLVYLDSSVLVAYFFEEDDQPWKFQAAQGLMNALVRGSVRAVVSFYALPELYAFVQENRADQVNALFRASMVQLFELPIQVFPFLEREQFNALRKSFSISDPNDVRHVAVALATFCDAIITFDRHFQQARDLIPVFSPDEYLAILTDTDGE